MVLTVNLKKLYTKQIAPDLMKHFIHKNSMQAPRLEKIVINQGLGMATDDKRIIDVVTDKLTQITGQKTVATHSRRNIFNFKLRRQIPVGVVVTLRRGCTYEFLERLVCIALPHIRDLKGINSKLDGCGNYMLGIPEQTVPPEISFDSITKILGMNITLVTSAPTDEEGFELLKHFGPSFRTANR